MFVCGVLIAVFIIGSNLKESEVTHWWQTIMSRHHPTPLNSVPNASPFEHFLIGVEFALLYTLLSYAPTYTRTQSITLEHKQALLTTLLSCTWHFSCSEGPRAPPYQFSGPTSSYRLPQISSHIYFYYCYSSETETAPSAVSGAQPLELTKTVTADLMLATLHADPSFHYCVGCPGHEPQHQAD